MKKKKVIKLLLLSFVWGVFSQAVWFIVGMSNPTNDSWLAFLLLYTIALPAGLSFGIINFFDLYGNTQYMLLVFPFSFMVISLLYFFRSKLVK